MSPSAAWLSRSALALTLWAGTAAASEQLYDLKKADVVAKPGQRAVTSVTIAARKGWHLNADAPLTLNLTPDPGVTVEKNRLTRADLAQNTQDLARFDVAFTAAEPGKKAINAEARFVMCQETTCKPVREKITLAVDVAPAAPAGKKK